MQRETGAVAARPRIIESWLNELHSQYCKYALFEYRTIACIEGKYTSGGQGVAVLPGFVGAA